MAEMETISEEDFWIELRKLMFQDEAPSVKQQALKLAAEMKGWAKGSRKDKPPQTTDLPKPLQEVAKKMRRKSIKQDGPDEFGLTSGTSRMEEEDAPTHPQREAEEIAGSTSSPLSTEQPESQTPDR